MKSPDRVPAEFPRKSSEGDPIQWVRTSHLREFCDPFAAVCWLGIATPVRLDDVRAALDAGSRAYSGPAPEDTHARNGAAPWLRSRREHVRRIAWFVANGFQQPLSIDVGVPSLGCHVGWIVQDGNHRLAAGIFRQETMGEDPWLPLVVSGSIAYARECGLWRGR